MKYEIQVKVKKFGWFTAMRTNDLNEFKRKYNSLKNDGHEMRFTKMGVITNVCD